MSIFGPNYVVFGVGRFLIGLGQCGFFVPGFAIGKCNTNWITFNDDDLLYTIVQRCYRTCFANTTGLW